MKKDPTKTMTMVEYVILSCFPRTHEEGESEYILAENFYRNVPSFAFFLKSELKLGDFIPTDLEENILEKPDYFDKWLDKSIPRTGREPEDWGTSCKQYQEALDRLVYSGFDIRRKIKGLTSVILNDIEIFFDNRFEKSEIYSFEEPLKTHEDLAKLRLDYTEQQVKRLGL